MREHDPVSTFQVSKFLLPEIVFGHGSLSEAGFAARRLDARRVFVVTDPGTVEAGWYAELVEHLGAVGLPHVLWHGVTPNPEDHEVAAGFQAYVASGCDVIIGLGGGSVIDAAKAIAVVSTNGGWILDYEGVDRVTEAIPPLIIIPCTPGTGADPPEAAYAAADRVRDPADSVGCPKGLSDLGVTEADIPNLNTNTLGEACMLTNPRDPSVQDSNDIFRAAL